MEDPLFHLSIEALHVFADVDSWLTLALLVYVSVFASRIIQLSMFSFSRFDIVSGCYAALGVRVLFHESSLSHPPGLSLEMVHSVAEFVAHRQGMTTFCF